METMLPGFAGRFDFGHHLVFDLEVFDHHLDDPVRLFDPVEIIFHIADGDQLHPGGAEQPRWFGFLQKIYSLIDDPVANDRALQSQPLGLLRGSQLEGDDIHQVNGDPRVGQMAGDSPAHDTGTDDHGFFYLKTH